MAANAERGAEILDRQTVMAAARIVGKNGHNGHGAELQGIQIDGPENGAELLDAARVFIRRFVAFPDQHCLIAATLWAAHTHMIEHFYTTPRLMLSSPEAGSGKTRVLEVLDLLVSEPMFCLSASPAAIFRTLSKQQITLLVDECDAIFAKRGKDDGNEDLRALLNAGYKRGATIPRCVGPKHDVQSFKVHCATALAGLGDLPETIMSRSIIIRMRRRAPDEVVEPFRSREQEPVGHELRAQLARWAVTVGARAGASWPPLPDGIVDRPAEIWEPLIAVADQAGGYWPDLARAACVALAKSGEQNISLGVRLLADLRTIFGDADALPTKTILTRLCDGQMHGLDADAPWGEMYGKPLSERGLASMLKKYGVASRKVKIDGLARQGYRRDQLWDAWMRYLPQTAAKAEPAEPVEPSAQNEVPEVPERQHDPEPVEPTFAVEVPEVPEVPDIPMGEGAWAEIGNHGGNWVRDDDPTDDDSVRV